MPKQLTLLALLTLFAGWTHAQTPMKTHWKITSPSAISLDLKKEGTLPYEDNIEMAGKRVAGIISYAIDEEGMLTLEREIFFPQLHEFKAEQDSRFHDYRAYLQDVYTDDLLPKIYVNHERFVPGKVESTVINGMLNFEHQPSKSGLQLSRVFFPSMDERLFVEIWTLKNTSEEELELVTGNSRLQLEDFGAKGKYTRVVVSDVADTCILKPGEEVSFSIKIMAKISGEKFPQETAQEALDGREAFLAGMAGSLQLETPNQALNTLFAFSKIRGSESIYESELGLIHSPGGGRYYVGIWANDQAEYINPFFPYLGYATGNESAMNCFRAFAKETNPEYTNIRYSFEIEGLVKPFPKDRGDAAMIAYGAAHFAMANGDTKTARELWPLIEWCLEYCKRKLNDEGVVASESDEMEGRIETGDANLSTSSLYYGALVHAADLANSLGIAGKQCEQYTSQAEALKKAIDTFFGTNVEGLDTYKYFKEHAHLRHWICLPLVVGIHDRKDATIEALFERLWTDNGVHVEKNNPKVSDIFWDRGTLYALRGTFAAGETEKSLEKLIQFSERRLLSDRVPYVVEASPEGSMAHLSAESGLYCRIFTEGMFGIHPTGLNRFELTPRLPKEWDHMNLRHIKAFGNDFDIEVLRSGKQLEVRILTNGKSIFSKTIAEGETVSHSFPKN